MSYSGSNENNPLNGDGAFVVSGVGGAIVMGPQGPITQFNVLGNKIDANFGDTSGPNAVNPSGSPSGIRLSSQNNFRNRL
jgi:hypothetical protein